MQSQEKNVPGKSQDINLMKQLLMSLALISNVLLVLFSSEWNWS